MQKNLKTKLEQMSKEQLFELLEELCNLPDVQKKIKVMVAPSKSDIDRLIQKLSCRCEIYMCNSCNEKDYDRMCLALTPIYSAYRCADINMAAYITWKTYCVLLDNDIENYYELIGDMISDLSFNMRQQPDMFTHEEKMLYVLAAVTEGRTPIVLTERYDHAKLLAEILREKSRNVVLLSGKGTAKEKREILQGLSQIPADEPLILVATGRYVGEGFDLPRLDTLFLAMPVSWKGTLAQYAGRLHRNYEGIQEVLIYDYVDIRVPMLERMYHKRLSGYAAIGYTVRGDRMAPAAENRIFSQEEYWDTFSMDIANAQKDILITSPYLHIAQVKRFLKLIPKDIHLTVVTGDESSIKPEAWEKVSNAVKLLEDAGAKVILQPKVYQRYAVIDKSTLWYGGINFLGFEKTAHGAMRLCSAELAKELNEKINNEQEQMSLPEV